MAVLTVFLAPDGPDGVLDVLTDLSGAGLLDPFLWVCESQVTRSGSDAVAITEGRRRPTRVEDALADRSYERVRLCVVVPLSGSRPPVSMSVEQRLVETVSFNGGTTRVTNVRCIVARPGHHAAAKVIGRGGWHNVLLAPEDANGPTRGRQVLPPSDDPVEIGRYAAPAVAGVVGLWQGADQCHLDPLPAPPGIRVARTFYRRVDASQVEQKLREQVLSTMPHLPLPRDSNGSAAYVDDVGGACAGMAHGLWERYERTLIGPREQPQREPVTALNWRNALAWFFRFLMAALRKAPGDWVMSARNRASIAAAGRIHRSLFGSQDAAYTVVAGGMTPQGLPAGWRDMHAASGRLDELLPDEKSQHDGRVDLGPMWRDYASGALTLTDAGDRGIPEMPPVTVGAARRRGVLRSVADCVPSPEHDFDGIPNHLVAQIGVSEARLQAGDVLGAETLRRRLVHLGHRDPAFAPDVGQTLQELDEWEHTYARSYSVQVGRTLAAALLRVIGEMQHYLGILQRAAALLSAVPEHPRPWLMRLLAFLAVVGVIAGVALGVAGAVSVRIAVLVALGPVALWIGVAVCRFIADQRRMFQDLAARQTLLGDADAARVNLRQAMTDARRLGEAYEQYLVWSRIVGAVLRRPYGGIPQDAGASGGIVRGLPRTTKTALALVDEMAVGRAATTLRADLFATGWLTGPWEKHLRGAGTQLGSYELMSHPERLQDLQGGSVHESALRRWSDLLVREGTRRDIGDSAWADVLESLNGPHSALGVSLLAAVRELGHNGYGPTDLTDFLGGVDRPREEAGRQEFAPTHFTAEARAKERARVDIHGADGSRTGLSRVVALVQMTEAIPSWEVVVAGDEDPQTVPPPPPPPPSPEVPAFPRGTELHPSPGYGRPAPSIPSAPDGF